MVDVMSRQDLTPVERRCDVAVIGGSAAGLAAALQIQRQNRSVIVVDSGEPRNAPAAHMHGYLGYDGVAPAVLITAGRAELRRYGGEVLQGSVAAVRRDSDGFLLDLGNVAVRARRAVAATGVTDELPSIPGIAERWGKTVLHCPFCHGYEVRGQRLVQIVTHASSLHPALLFAHLSGKLTLVVSPELEIEANELAAFEQAGAQVIRGSVARVTERPDHTLSGVELTDGYHIAADAVVVSPYMRPRLEPFLPCGLTAEAHPAGVADFVATSATGETSVDGLYAAGNLTDPSQQVIAAAANGSYVGAMVALDLATEDRDEPGRPSPAESEWTERYSGDQVWSGRPNGTLVSEIESLEPGSALEIGAGEGGDALWLAEHGWDVTATDVAKTGLDRLERIASDSGAAIRCLRADANGRHAFGDATYDLVSLFYPAISRTGDDLAVANILSAVAPGGTFLAVGHAPSLPETSQTASTPVGGSVVPWDRGSFVGLDHLEAAIRAEPDWTIVANEVRGRPTGSASHHHHDTDHVLRAQRKSV